MIANPGIATVSAPKSCEDQYLLPQVGLALYITHFDCLWFDDCESNVLGLHLTDVG